MSNQHYIIIGAGIAGLCTAYNLKKQNLPFIILEKSSKKDIGGRMGSPLFHGTHVAKGAGVGRKRKDKLLLQLLNELKVPYKEYKSSHQYAETIEPCDVKETFLFIKHKYEEGEPLVPPQTPSLASHSPSGHHFSEQNYLIKNANPKQASREPRFPPTFKEFAEPLLGKDRYKHFITCAGYTDYENEDIESTLYDYGFDDNYINWTGLSIPWDILLDKLIDKIGVKHIHHNTTVTSIDRLGENLYKVHTEKGKTYEATHITIATTITPLRKLLPQVPEYKQICSQPFLRVYGKFSKDCIPLMMEKVRTLTIVPGPLYKIIPMNPEEGIYMIVYTDNKGATTLKSHKENTPENRNYLCRKLEKALGLPKEALHLLSIIDFYWEDGTHYYKPLDKKVYKTRREFLHRAQNPYPNIKVVGEMVSQNQGWVEGALESLLG